MRFYFDLVDGDEVLRDEEGLELSSITQVQKEAALSLADMAKDVISQSLHDGSELGHRLAIQVRDDVGPVLQVRFTFALNVRSH